ncbi:MAG: UDP-N-acetylmuramoyl-tripeptide--D-alanyl-D-alanine ligase [Clostridia bacterium]|nr:UDP-N-acetylmuramoyl-tripeptide--D-alanyl-D-alanine ligase [Clostridia bacterium]
MLALIIRTVLFILCLALAIKPLLVLQQVSYRVKEFCLAIKPLDAITNICLVAVSVILSFFSWYLNCILAVIYCINNVIYCMKKRKKPLVITNRLKRLLAVYGALILISTICQMFYIRVFSLAFCAPILLIFANLICNPIEKRISYGFIKKAMQKLKRVNPTVIAITGSFGKTSFKHVLAHILQSTYKVCATPKSYNTPMGISKCINEELKDGDEIFIAEVGARYVGDVAEICEFINPEIAVITAIGNQHLATFGTVERLRAEKFSIISKAKRVFINADEVKDIPYINKDKEITVCGRSGTWQYSNVKMSKAGQSFTVSGEQSSYTVTCKLLADYVPSMLTLAVAIAQSLNISQKNIKNSIKTLKPIAHRLEILYNDKDVIIDDAYNSNETGFISAINLLSLYGDKVKVIITPGVVELGKEQEAVNIRLARYASKHADYIFTYGVNATAIKKGSGDKCEICSSLDECMKRYKRIQGERAVLFENDLPDKY